MCSPTIISAQQTHRSSEDRYNLYINGPLQHSVALRAIISYIKVHYIEIECWYTYTGEFTERRLPSTTLVK